MRHYPVEVPAWAQEWNREILYEFFHTLDMPAGVVSEEICTTLAKSILGTNNIRHADHQGAASFTLISLQVQRVVQFRRKPLDAEMLALARTIYGNLTPKVTRSDREFPLPIYIIEIVPGIDFTNLIPPPSDRSLPVDKYYRGVISLANFIGKAASFPQSACRAHGWTISAISLLDTLLAEETLTKVAPEVVEVVRDAREHVHLLGTLPAVLTHSDLSAVNLFLNEDGSLSGVIDWDNACIEAFGMSIWSLYDKVIP